MKNLQVCSSSFTSPPLSLQHPQLIANISQQPRKLQTARNLKPHAAKSGGFSLKPVANRCKKCKGQGAIECPGCKGTGKNKKNGNIFERWKCFECQGFGLKSCPDCGTGGLTPEQRGER
ncbi:SSUH2-like protein [Perilla frutescens var. hirtella]|uniref:SSUH2-like protein n=1 Tax=Perilla frutescens var. hirtella TaxID=608512 RepID=A0AAD4PBD8_PERFH|nr:SSUH2-like protein [Perilla frutescens var. frutescens]KAH6776605.1 SSUH2-like protein [Perilla frutescens var. hirtella]KAH6834054.1 SSUH2-like protein [Perilla frutescens var. hirtella]